MQYVKVEAINYFNEYLHQINKISRELSNFQKV